MKLGVVFFFFFLTKWLVICDTFSVQFDLLCGEYPLEKEMATHPSILARRIPWREEPGRLQSMGSTQRQTLLKQLSTHA